MQVCSYTLSCKDFDYDFFPKKESIFINKLYEDADELFALFPIPLSKQYYLKISYTKKQLRHDIRKLLLNITILFVIATLVIMVLSFFLTLYTLKPIREALRINQEFIKDILHDFNTPISAMMINLEMLKRDCQSPFVERIHQSIETIISLQDNLKIFLKNIKGELEEIDLAVLVKKRVRYFQSLYPHLHFSIQADDKAIFKTQKELITRILDNLLSNACKYNKPNGSVRVIVHKDHIIIEDSGQGIKNSKKAFDRFYKESERGIGIGLSIVKKLCDELGIKISLSSEKGKGTRVDLWFNNS